MPAPKVVKHKPQVNNRPKQAAPVPTPAKSNAKPDLTKGEVKPLVLPTAVINFEDVDPSFRDIVESLYTERRNTKAAEDHATAQRKELDESLDSLMIDMNVGKIVMPDGFVISLVKSSSAPKIDAKLLLSLGVPADVIAQSTVPGNPFKYVLVADRNKKED